MLFKLRPAVLPALLALELHFCRPLLLIYALLPFDLLSDQLSVLGWGRCHPFFFPLFAPYLVLLNGNYDRQLTRGGANYPPARLGCVAAAECT
jgi:hypothetical protein